MPWRLAGVRRGDAVNATGELVVSVVGIGELRPWSLGVEACEAIATLYCSVQFTSSPTADQLVNRQKKPSRSRCIASVDEFSATRVRTVRLAV